MVPVTVTFAESVNVSTATATINGTFCTPLGGGYSNTVVFPYTVKTVDTTELTITKMKGYDPAGNWGTNDAGGKVPNAKTETPILLDAVDASPTVNTTPLIYTPAAADQEEKTVSTTTITWDIENNQNVRDLLLSGTYSDGSNFYCGKLAASLDGGQTTVPLVFDNGTAPTKMTATIEVDALEAAARGGKPYVAELYTLNADHTPAELLLGRYAEFTVAPPVPLTAANIETTTSADWPTVPFYVNKVPALNLSHTIAGSGYTWNQIKWSTSDPSIAGVEADGTVRIYGAGKVDFYVEAVNGNISDYRDGADVPEESWVYKKKVASLDVQQGSEPYFDIPEESINILSGDDLTLRWASNFVQKNETYGDPNVEGGKRTTFTIEVFAGTDLTAAPAQTHTVTYDPADKDDPQNSLWVNGSPNQSFTLRGLDSTDLLGYTVRLSGALAAGVPGADACPKTDTVRVYVRSKPVTVKLIRPESYFVVNSGTLEVPYTLSHFDAVGAGAEFKLTVTDNATGTKVIETDDYRTYGGVDDGKFIIDLEKADTKNFRIIYDVTIQAKNTAEKDWSRDGFTLYIYDQSCLDLVVQPVERDGKKTVTVEGDKITMSNQDWISGLSQDQILALNRKIDLQTGLSINYTEREVGRGLRPHGVEEREQRHRRRQLSPGFGL